MIRLCFTGTAAGTTSLLSRKRPTLICRLLNCLSCVVEYALVGGLILSSLVMLPVVLTASGIGETDDREIEVIKEQCMDRELG